jgi:hypothetical protein
MCVLSHYQDGPLLFRNVKKIKASELPEKEFLLEVLWHSIIMQVKRVTFQRMGSGGKGRIKNIWDVSGGQSAASEVYLIFPR